PVRIRSPALDITPLPNTGYVYLPMVGSAASKAGKSGTGTALGQKEDAPMPRRIPSYRCYKPKNLGLVVLDGTHYYLGKYGTPESLAEYNRLIQEWLTHSRVVQSTRSKPADLTIHEMLLAFWKHAEQHYRSADGASTGELDNLKEALKPLK